VSEDTRSVSDMSRQGLAGDLVGGITGPGFRKIAILARSCDRRAVVAADDALGNLEFAVMRNSIVGGYLGHFHGAKY